MNVLKTAKALGSNIVGGVKTSIGGGLLAALGVYFIINNTLESQLYSIGLIVAGFVLFILPDGKELVVEEEENDEE
jgi:hypothetical protein